MVMVVVMLPRSSVTMVATLSSGGSPLPLSSPLPRITTSEGAGTGGSGVGGEADAEADVEAVAAMACCWKIPCTSQRAR
jgi:hypothetical protein